MLKTFSLICGYSSNSEAIYAEETIFLMHLNIPEKVKDKDQYLWSEAESILLNKVPELGAKKTFKLSSGEAVIGKLFDTELRVISNVSFNLKETSSTFFQLHKHLMIFKSKSDYLDYLAANEADNPDVLIDAKMSTFFLTSTRE